MVHVHLQGTYRKSIRQQNMVGRTIKKEVSLTCMKIIDPAMGWFEIIKVPMFDLDKVTGRIGEYINESYGRVIQFFNNTRKGRYPRPQSPFLKTDLSLNDTSLLLQ